MRLAKTRMSLAESEGGRGEPRARVLGQQGSDAGAQWVTCPISTIVSHLVATHASVVDGE